MPFTVEVPGDAAVEVAFGPPDVGRAILYMHGHCGNPVAFTSWAEAATRFGTLISLRGDTKCKGRSRRKWSYDYKGIDRRVRAAIAAVDAKRRDLVDSVAVTPLDPENVVLIGYSQGAKRVEFMTHHFPSRYRRVASIAVADEPSPYRLKPAEKVLLMGGAWDARKHIKEGFDKLKTLQKRVGAGEVRYMEFPKARHGEYGPEANEVMAEALEWLLK